MLAQANHVLDDDRRLGKLEAKQIESVEVGEEYIEMVSVSSLYLFFFCLDLRGEMEYNRLMIP